MKKLPFFLILFLAFSGRADLLVYSAKLSATSTASNGVVKISEAGWLIFDTDTTDVAEVISFPQNQLFTTQFPSDSEFDYLDNDTYSLISIIPDSGRGATMLKGKNSSVYSGLGFWTMPKTFTASGSVFLNGSFVQGSGSIVFDAKDSSTVNLDGDTLQDAVNYLSALLTQKGFTAF